MSNRDPQVAGGNQRKDRGPKGDNPGNSKGPHRVTDDSGKREPETNDARMGKHRETKDTSGRWSKKGHNDNAGSRKDVHSGGERASEGKGRSRESAANNPPRDKGKSKVGEDTNTGSDDERVVGSALRRMWRKEGRCLSCGVPPHQGLQPEAQDGGQEEDDTVHEAERSFLVKAECGQDVGERRHQAVQRLLPRQVES